MLILFDDVKIEGRGASKNRQCREKHVRFAKAILCSVALHRNSANLKVHYSNQEGEVY